MFLITSIVQMSVTYVLKRRETFMRKKSFYKPSNFLKSKLLLSLIQKFEGTQRTANFTFMVI